VIPGMGLSSREENKWAWIEDLRRGETILGGGLMRKALRKSVFAWDWSSRPFLRHARSLAIPGNPPERG